MRSLATMYGSILHASKGRQLEFLLTVMSLGPQRKTTSMHAIDCVHRFTVTVGVGSCETRLRRALQTWWSTREESPVTQRSSASLVTPSVRQIRILKPSLARPKN